MEWKPAYKRGTAMQAPLALAGFALGLAASFGAENRVHSSARCASVTAASLRSSASSEAVLRPAWTIVRFPEFHSLERTM